jgi:hypothetical protein
MMTLDVLWRLDMMGKTTIGAAIMMGAALNVPT